MGFTRYPVLMRLSLLLSLSALSIIIFTDCHSMNPRNIPLLKPYQIVCLDAHPHQLYGEVIQIIEERELCWMRPLILVKTSEDSTEQTWTDLRYTSDLFYPVSYFRPALDTEIIPLLDNLVQADIDPNKIPSHRSQLNTFLKEIMVSEKQL